jgi:hypothetical protein
LSSLDEIEEFALLEKTDSVITASHRVSTYEDARNSASASDLLEIILDVIHVRTILDRVFGERDFLTRKHILHFLAKGTV